MTIRKPKNSTKSAKNQTNKQNKKTPATTKNIKKSLTTNNRLTKIKKQAISKEFIATKHKEEKNYAAMLNLFLTITGCFTFIIIFEYLWHDIVLIDFYHQSSQLWQYSSETPYYIKYGFLNQFFMSILLTLIFQSNYNDNNLTTIVKFGFFTGFFMALIQNSVFAYMPITSHLAFLWFIGSILQGLGIALIIANIIKKPHA